MNTPVTVRFAPSPTGRLHIGSARTALYNYLLAKKVGGRFILRIEDTDQKRFDSGAEAEIIEGLHWLGIEWDEGPDIGGPHAPYLQTLAKDTYLEHARQLIEKDHAYPCFCTPERIAQLREQQRQRKEQPQYDGTCRRLDPSESARRVAAGESHVIRFKTPDEGTTSVTDVLRGEITVENKALDDFILVKSDGLALYHLAAMVDDHRMAVTHVIRGSEWLSTLPLHALVVRAFGWREPVWCHLSLFLKPSGKGKMSKRDTAQAMTEGHSIFIRDLKEMGYIPEGILNWIALMGVSFDEAEDVFTLEEMVKRFELKHLSPSPAAVNFEKADHFNGTHIRMLTVDDLAARLKPVFEKAGFAPEDARLRKVAAVVQVRIVTLEDAVEMGGFFFRETVSPDPKDLPGKGLTPAQSADCAAGRARNPRRQVRRSIRRPRRRNCAPWRRSWGTSRACCLG